MPENIHKQRVTQLNGMCKSKEYKSPAVFTPSHNALDLSKEYLRGIIEADILTHHINLRPPVKTWIKFQAREDEELKEYIGKLNLF